MKLFIHHLKSPIVRKVLLVAHEAKVDLEIERVAWNEGDHLQSYYKNINPNAKFPSLIDDGFLLWESNAIILYLAEKAQATHLLPTALKDKMNVTKWLFWESAQFAIACLNLTYIYFHPAKQLAPEFLERYHLEFRSYAEILNTLLSENRYICGEQITLADFSIASNLTYARVRGFPLDDFPNLARWFDEIEQRPSWIATTPKD